MRTGPLRRTFSLHHVNRYISFLLLVLFVNAVFAQTSGSPTRDPRAIDILSRAVQAAGGAEVLSTIHDITQHGQITFFWGDGVNGSVTIRMLGGDHFRMETHLPQGKEIWTVRNGRGKKTELGGLEHPLPDQDAVDLGRLTFPIGHVAASLADPSTSVSFVGIEQQGGRSAYHLKLSGKLGLGSPGVSTKDLIIDALTFDLMSIKDCTVVTFSSGAKQPKISPSRELVFSNYRAVSGVRVPFSILANLMGNRTMDITLSQITFNSNLSDGDFTK